MKPRRVRVCGRWNLDFQNGLPRARCALAMTGYKKYGGRADVGIGPYAPFTDRTP